MSASEVTAGIPSWGILFWESPVGESSVMISSCQTPAHSNITNRDNSDVTDAIRKGRKSNSGEGATVTRTFNNSCFLCVLLLLLPCTVLVRLTVHRPPLRCYLVLASTGRKNRQWQLNCSERCCNGVSVCRTMKVLRSRDGD
jgi:hypothetical protein